MNPHDALGPPNKMPFDICGYPGFVILEWEDVCLVDGPGYDLVVHEISGYNTLEVGRVYISTDNETYVDLGEANTTANQDQFASSYFDIRAPGIFRFINVSDMMGLSNVWPYKVESGGFDLDSVELLNAVQCPVGTPSEIDCDPDTLNINSNGRWITCYIELPEGYHPKDIDGSTVKMTIELEEEITSFETRATHPQYSPEGTKIAFNAGRTYLLFDVWVMNADGSGQAQLTFNSDTNEGPKWSPDGTKIAFARGPLYGETDIWVMGHDGSDQRQLTFTPFREYGPSWSPDGSRIAFLSDEGGEEDVWIMDIDGTNRTQITHNMDSRGSTAWSPDGNRIAFTSYIDGNYDIYTIDIDGSNLMQLTSSISLEIGPEWSSDGRMIAYTSDISGNPDIWMMNSYGSNKTQLTTYQGLDAEPSWSPDGATIAFSSDRDGYQNLWVMAMGLIPAESDEKYGFVKSESSYITDHDNDGIMERMVKFKRDQVQATLFSGDSVELHVMGELLDGTHFEGCDTVRVNRPMG
jgi:Tol biopolymer transport system component